MPQLELPTTERALVDACASDLAAASASGSSDAAVEEARLRWAWALAHSASSADVQRACELLSLWLESKQVGDKQREPLYLLAVAHYRSGSPLEAKRWAEAALNVAPHCSQAKALRTACEEQLAEDALLAGLGVAGVGLAALGAALLLGGMRRKS